MKNQKIKRKDYEKELLRLQAQLCLLQDWVKHKGVRVIIVFEGRDGAGKGGTIKAITERVSPRKVKLPERSRKGAYDDQATLQGRRFISELYSATEKNRHCIVPPIT